LCYGGNGGEGQNGSDDGNREENHSAAERPLRDAVEKLYPLDNVVAAEHSRRDEAKRGALKAIRNSTLLLH